MSEIVFTRSIENNIYIITISMVSLEDGDYKDMIKTYGEEAIDIGGEILDNLDAVLATLPPKKIKISELSTKPIIQKFSETVYSSQAKEIASAWYEQAKTKIEEYIAVKTSEFDDFSTEETIYI
jgi:hypothetical protein